MNVKGSERINLHHEFCYFLQDLIKIRAYVEPTININLLAKRKIRSKGYYSQVSSEFVDKKT